MRMNWARVVLLTLVAASFMAGSAQANISGGYLDVWYTVNDTAGMTRPGGAGTDPTLGWVKWVNGPTTFDLAPGADVWFAMDNDFRRINTKTGEFVLSTNNANFFGTGTTWNSNIGVSFGYQYDTSDDPTWDGLPFPTYDTWSKLPGAGGYTGTINFTVIPQPSWEWVNVVNNSTTTGNFVAVVGKSNCTQTPEPSLGLLLLAGIIPLGIGLRRRQRRISAK